MVKTNVEQQHHISEQYWFKRKKWGWVPATWQGWVSTFLYLVLVLGLVLTREEPIPGNPDSGSNFLVFGLPITLLSVAYILLLYRKGDKGKK